MLWIEKHKPSNAQTAPPRDGVKQMIHFTSSPKRASTVPMDVKYVVVYLLSCVPLIMTLWTVALLSVGFSRQESWSGLPFPSWGYLPDPGIKPMSPALADEFFTICSTREAPDVKYRAKKKKKIANYLFYWHSTIIYHFLFWFQSSCWVRLN